MPGPAPGGVSARMACCWPYCVRCLIQDIVVWSLAFQCLLLWKIEPEQIRQKKTYKTKHMGHYGNGCLIKINHHRCDPRFPTNGPKYPETIRGNILMSFRTSQWHREVLATTPVEKGNGWPLVRNWDARLRRPDLPGARWRLLKRDFARLDTYNYTLFV